MLGKGKYFIRYKQGNRIPVDKNLSTICEEVEKVNLQ